MSDFEFLPPLPPPLTWVVKPAGTIVKSTTPPVRIVMGADVYDVYRSDTIIESEVTVE